MFKFFEKQATSFRIHRPSAAIAKKERYPPRMLYERIIEF